MLLEKEQVIKELCKLCTNVNDEVFRYSVATDCFCTKEDSCDYRFDEEVLTFIKDAVLFKIKNDKENNL